MDKIYYDFTEEEKNFLLGMSNYYFLIEYQKAITEMQNTFQACWYEIKTTGGNWSFKDKVLHQLFKEFIEKLDSFSEKMIEFEKKLKEFEDDLPWGWWKKSVRTPNRLKDRNGIFKLFKYIVERIKENYTCDRLSDCYTHIHLDKALRITEKRFEKVLTHLNDFVENYSQLVNPIKMNEIIIANLPSKLPAISTVGRRINDYNFQGLYQLEKQITKILKPRFGNSEYRLGLKELWRDASGKTCYFFDKSLESSLDIEDNHRVVILEQNKSNFLENNYISSGEKPWSTIFEEGGEKEFFDAWLGSPHVRENLIRKIIFPFLYKIEDCYIDNEEEFLPGLINEYRKIINHKVGLYIEYYGDFYTNEELKDTFLIKAKEHLEKHHEAERNKKIIDSAISIFPLVFPLEEEKEKEDV